MWSCHVRHQHQAHLFEKYSAFEYSIDEKWSTDLNFYLEMFFHHTVLSVLVCSGRENADSVWSEPVIVVFFTVII